MFNLSSVLIYVFTTRRFNITLVKIYFERGNDCKQLPITASDPNRVFCRWTKVFYPDCGSHNTFRCMWTNYSVSHRDTIYIVHSTFVRIIRNSQVKRNAPECKSINFNGVCKNFVNHKFQLSHRTGIGLLCHKKECGTW